MFASCAGQKQGRKAGPGFDERCYRVIVGSARALYEGQDMMPNSTWRLMGSYKWGYKSPNMGYNYSYPTYNPTYNYP